MGVTGQVREFIARELATDGNGLTLADRDLLVERGVLDSMGVLRLILFLEERFGIRVADHELVPEDFATLERIAAFVASKGALAPR